MGFFDDLIGAAKSAARSVSSEAKVAAEGAVKSAGAAVAGGAKTVQVTLGSLPRTLAEMQAMPQASLADPNGVAALAVAALCAFPSDRAASIAMLNFLRGPRPMSPMDESFIRDRFMDGKDYVPRSYFDGASPENDYTPTQPLTVTVKEQSNSRDQEGYITLYLTSGGADSPRPVTLRCKPSTNQWFLWEYSGVLASIRIPKTQDAWA